MKKRNPFIIVATTKDGRQYQFNGYVEASQSLGIPITTLHRLVNQGLPRLNKHYRYLEGWQFELKAYQPERYKEAPSCIK